MTKRLPRVALVVLCLMMVVASAGVVTNSAVGSRFDVRVNGYVFEPGSTVALELRAAGGPPCFGADVLVEGIDLVNAKGDVVWNVTYDSLVFTAEWLGLVPLRDPNGAALDPGAYEIRVLTSEGTFAAGLHIVPAVQFPALERLIAGVPVCDEALRVYRVLMESDNGATATLRVSDRLMVVLAGNPTTGYSWSASPLYGYEPLRATDEEEYRTGATGRLGAGGLYIYRYWAVDEGSATLAYNYARPWEAIGPISTATFTITVR